MTGRFLQAYTRGSKPFPYPKFYTVIPVRKPLTFLNEYKMQFGEFSMCEMPAAYVLDVVTARKDHLCIECKGWIKRGEKYNKHHGVWDGSGFTYKVCLECEKLRADIDKDVPYVEERTAFGNLCESVFEGGEREFMRRFLETKEKRKGPIAPWMHDHFDREMNKEDDKIEEQIAQQEFFDNE